MLKGQIIIFSLIAILIGGCKEKYAPLATTVDNHYLVVEGLINTSGPTNIRLSRTVKLVDTVNILPELFAQIIAEGDNSNSYLLTDQGNGNYFSDDISFPANSKCRLRIKTWSGQEYLSDFVPVKETPAIDSVNWVEKSEGVHIFANTHDLANKTRYYRWEYQEDWEVHAAFQSFWEYVNGDVVRRDPNINIFFCWQSQKSTRIIIASSVKLNSDILKSVPVIEIPAESQKIGVLYSILVKQYALTGEGFEYWEQVLKNSEQLGSIFDPMPSQTIGNIHCLTNPTEPVIGYISAGTTVEKRIFIARNELLPRYFRYDDCREITVPADSVYYYFELLGYVPINREFRPPSYTASFPPCIDCRFKGSNIKPAFWP